MSLLSFMSFVESGSYSLPAVVPTEPLVLGPAQWTQQVRDITGQVVLSYDLPELVAHGVVTAPTAVVVKLQHGLPTLVAAGTVQKRQTVTGSLQLEGTAPVLKCEAMVSEGDTETLALIFAVMNRR